MEDAGKLGEVTACIVAKTQKGLLTRFEFDTVKPMALDLETLRTEIQAHLDESDFSVFHGYHTIMDALNQVSWDTERRPDFREFLTCAHKADAKVVIFYHRNFSLDQIDTALDQLEDSDFTREEKRSFETRLRQLQAYEGFTCSLELSFRLVCQIFMFEIHTDWYDALNDILAELDVATEEQEDNGTLGGYFSNN